MQKIVTHLWFDTQAKEAADFYVSLFKNSRITDVTSFGEMAPGWEGNVGTVTFELDGREFIGLNAGPAFKFNEAISLLVRCEDQAEVDRLWDAFLTNGGEESMCGWLKDRWGLSWQITPMGIENYVAGPDKEGAKRAVEAMLQMRKLDIAALQRAYAGS